MWSPPWYLLHCFISFNHIFKYLSGLFILQFCHPFWSYKYDRPHAICSTFYHPFLIMYMQYLPVLSAPLVAHAWEFWMFTVSLIVYPCNPLFLLCRSYERSSYTHCSFSVMGLHDPFVCPLVHLICIRGIDRPWQAISSWHTRSLCMNPFCQYGS